MQFTFLRKVFLWVSEGNFIGSLKHKSAVENLTTLQQSILSFKKRVKKTLNYIVVLKYWLILIYELKYLSSNNPLLLGVVLVYIIEEESVNFSHV